MKKISLIIALTLSIIACKKEEVKPAYTPRIYPMLYIFEVTGFKTDKTETVNCTDEYGNTRSFNDKIVLDTCNIFINGKLEITKSYYYYKKLNPFDTIDFYISHSQIDKNPKLTLFQQQSFDDPKHTFTPTMRSVIYKVMYTNELDTIIDPIINGKRLRDSVIFYRNNYFIKGRFIVPDTRKIL